MSCPARRLGGIGVGVAILLAGAAVEPASQEPSKEGPSLPVFEAEAALVAVPVFVTDKSGKAVPGLVADDFEIQDGGQRVPIVAFQAIHVHQDVALPEEDTLPVAVQAAASRQFLLLFDLQFSSPGGIIRSRAAARRFVEGSLGPKDLVAVATFRRTGLKLLTNFTTDREHVARAIETLGFVEAVEATSDPLGLSGEFEVASGAEGLGAMADREIVAESAQEQRLLRIQYQRRVADLMLSLGDLAHALGPLRGRKQIVFLSGGAAQTAFVDSTANASPLEAHGQYREDQLLADVVLDRMKQMFERAGVSDVVIHSVDLRGLEGPVDVSSRTGGNQGRGEGRLTLAALAAETGGTYIRPTNDFGRALAEVEQISRRYYVLAFQPADPDAKRGRPRALKVRVRRDGLTVSHRSAYVLPDASRAVDPAAARLAAAEAIAKGLSGGSLGLELMAVPYRDGDGQACVPALLRIDGRGLASAAIDGRVALEVYGYAVAGDRVLDTMLVETTLDLGKVQTSATSFRDDGLHVLTTFGVAPARSGVDLRFFVRAGGETGSIRRPVAVPAFADGETVLSQPIPILAASDRVIAPYESRKNPPLEVPFRVRGERFFPDVAPVLKRSASRDLCVFAWPGRRGQDGFEATGEISRPGEAPRALRIERGRIVPDTDGFDRYVVTVVPPDAPPGRYALRLEFHDPATGRTSRTETTIRLE